MTGFRHCADTSIVTLSHAKSEGEGAAEPPLWAVGKCLMVACWIAQIGYFWAREGPLLQGYSP